MTEQQRERPVLEYDCERFSAAGMTLGKTTRKPNEDHLVWIPKKNIFGVLDGVGGLPDGHDASRLVSEYITKESGAFDSGGTHENMQRKLFALLQSANEALVAEAKKRDYFFAERGLGPSTTISLVHIIEDEKETHLLVGHVGDSRVSLFDGTKLDSITKDDSIVRMKAYELFEERAEAVLEKLNRAVTIEELSEQEQELFRVRNVITESLGKVKPLIHVFMGMVPQEAYSILLTTDGVHDNLATQEMEDILANTSLAHESVSRMIERARVRSLDTRHFRAKPDDMSAIVIQLKKFGL